ncbi:MAG: class I SAM-dependent methyltransferase [Alphaproteobacteria bacterium]
MSPATAHQLPTEFIPNGHICPHCNTHELRQFQAKAHDVGSREIEIGIIECRLCKFAWQWPVSRTRQESREYFQENYQNKDPNSYFDPVLRKKIACMELEFVETLVGAPGSILDIGAGDGAFLQVASAGGWKAVGLDPAAEQNHQNESGVQIISGTVDDIDVNQKYDAITLWDVIEHVDDPRDLIEKCVSLLAIGGYLILETGNYQSAERISNGSNTRRHKS